MKSFKIMLLSFLILPCAFALGGCQYGNTSNAIVGIELASTTDSSSVYEITYADGTKDTLEIENGKDGAAGQDGADGQDGANGKDLTFEAVYDYAVREGYFQGTYWEFLQQYMNVNIPNDSETIAANKAILSAVSIYAEHPVITQEPVYSRNDYGMMVQVGTQEVKSIEMSAGAGVIYKLDKQSGDAYIITNYHVLYNNDSITQNKIGRKVCVYLYGSEDSIRKQYDSSGQVVLDADGFETINYGENAIECEYVGGSMTYDIAVLKVTGSQALKTSDARAVEIAEDYTVGEDAIAIGNPEAGGISVTRGIVSVDSEYINMTAVDKVTTVSFRVMRIDTAINSGNSGGGLFDATGKLIGIVNAKVKATGIDNIGYAIPLDLVIKVTENLIDNSPSGQKISKFTLGVSAKAENSKAVFDEQTAVATLTEDVIIDTVQADSAAERMGLMSGDVINYVSIQDSTGTTRTTYINRLYSLTDVMLEFRAGDHITINVMRGGDAIELSLDADNAYFKTID